MLLLKFVYKRTIELNVVLIPVGCRLIIINIFGSKAQAEAFGDSCFDAGFDFKNPVVGVLGIDQKF